MCAYVNKEKENKDYITIDNDIRDDRIKNVYLLYGPESYLVLQYREKLLRAMGAKDPDNSMNYAEFSGKDVNEDDIISLADTMPFFAEYRTILITDSGFFKSSPNRLPDYIKKEMPETTRIVFVESEKVEKDAGSKSESKEVDKRGRMYKAVKEKGNAVEFQRQSEITIKSWVANRLLKADNRRMSQETLDYFISKTGNDMSNVKSETDKLLAYTLGRSDITEEDIDEIVTTRLQDKVFEMITFVAEGQQKKALMLYYDLLALKVPVQRILYNINSQFNLMLVAKQLWKKGCNQSIIAEKMGMTQRDSWKIDKLLKQSMGYSVEQLRDAVTDCVVTDEKIKTGRLNDRLGLEMLIVKYSTKNK